MVNTHIEALENANTTRRISLGFKVESYAKEDIVFTSSR